MCDFAQNRAQSYTLLYYKTNKPAYFFFFYELRGFMTVISFQFPKIIFIESCKLHYNFSPHCEQ